MVMGISYITMLKHVWLGFISEHAKEIHQSHATDSCVLV